MGILDFRTRTVFELCNARSVQETGKILRNQYQISISLWWIPLMDVGCSALIPPQTLCILNTSWNRGVKLISESWCRVRRVKSVKYFVADDRWRPEWEIYTCIAFRVYFHLTRWRGDCTTSISIKVDRGRSTVSRSISPHSCWRSTLVIWSECELEAKYLTEYPGAKTTFCNPSDDL